MNMDRCFILILILGTGTENSQEGETFKLSCSYSTNNDYVWYRQYVGAKPKFLLFVDEYSSKFETDLRLYSKSTKEIKRVDLVIFSASVSDSALYYCALRPTVTGNTRTLPSDIDLLLL
uniref:Immunoglobulin domain-containing protein n=1 Tax=Cyprinus carpio TaxID=7962 RepID=A0A8C1RZX9_CYPCA